MSGPRDPHATISRVRLPSWAHRPRRSHLYAVCAVSVLSCAYFQLPVQPGDVLFQDDFSLDSSGWDRYQDSTSSAGYESGQYRITVTVPQTDAWANPRLQFQDVRIEVEASKLGGPDDNVFGVLCRYQDPRNFYFLLISSDGYVGVGAYKDGRRKLLSNDSLLPSPAVIQGAATNFLRADCIGYKLDLYVNSFLVSQAQAAEWMEGDVGLLAGTYGQGGTDIGFDNFTVTQP